MGIEAWISEANVVIDSESVSGATSALEGLLESNEINFSNGSLDKLKSSGLSACLKMNFFDSTEESSQVVISGGDIDSISNELLNLFKSLAPFIKSGSYLNIEDEYEQYLNMIFDGNSVKFEGNAY